MSARAKDRALGLRLCWFAPLCLALLAPAVAQAEYRSARHRAQGGVAAARMHGVSSVFVQPAGMSVERPRGDYEAFIGMDAYVPVLSAAPPFGSETELAFDPALALSYLLFEELVVSLSAASSSEHWHGTESGEEATVSVSRRRSDFRVSSALLLPTEILPGDVSLGISYRVQVSELAFSAPSARTDFQAAGLAPFGLVIGLQFSPFDMLRIGAKLQTGVGVALADGGSQIGTERVEVEAHDSDPLAVSLGAALDVDRFGLAVDLEARDSVEEGSESIRWSGVQRALSSDIDWLPSYGLRVGLEYRADLEPAELPLRLGFATWSRDEGEEPLRTFLRRGRETQLTAGIGYDRGRFGLHGALRVGLPVEVGAPSPASVLSEFASAHERWSAGATLDLGLAF